MRNKILNRFLSKINQQTSTGCWEWIAGKHKFGYGMFWVNGKTIPAHRVAYKLFIGDIPESLSVLHKCDNPTCVNPEHLFLGTQMDNMKDMNSKGRRKSICGEQLPQTKINSDIVLDIRKKAQSQRNYATQYNISQSTVGEIQRNLIWKHVEPVTSCSQEGGPF